MNALNIINSILVRCNLSQNTVANPFEASREEIKEIVQLLNDKVQTLTTEIEFTQLKKECHFKVYSSWVERKYSIGDNVVNNGIRYQCVSGGESVIPPEGEGIFIGENLNVLNWQAGTSYNTNDYVVSDYKLYQVLEDGVSGEIPPEGEGNFNDGSLNYVYIRDVLFWENKGSAEQYPLQEIAPDLQSFSVNTFVDNYRRCSLIAITDEVWAKKKASQITTWSQFYMIMQDSVWLYPQYDEGSDISFFYYSKYAIKDKEGKFKDKFTDNEDTSLLPEQLLIWGVVSQWLQQKGLESAVNAQRQYEAQLDRYLAQNRSTGRIRLDGVQNDLMQNISDGFWNI